MAGAIFKVVFDAYVLLADSMMMQTPKPGLVTLALITVQLLFGINYVVSKIVIQAFDPFVWASLRIAISTVAMFGFAVMSGHKPPKLTKSYLLPMVGFALLGTIINQVCFLVGLKHTTSSNSAVLNTLIPVFTLLVVTIRGQEAFTFRRGVGFFLALTGVLVLRKIENFKFSDETALGDLLTVTNCFSYALFLSFSKSFFEKHDRIWTTAFLFLYGTIGITAVAAPHWANFQFPEMNPNLWAAAFFAVFGATLATYFLNFWALAHAKSSRVALYIYIQPVVTTLITWGFMGEPITLRTILSGLMIFLGMFFAMNWNFGPKRA